MDFTKEFFENYKTKDLVLRNELVTICGGTSHGSISRFNNDVIEDSVKSLSDDEKMEIMNYILPSFSQRYMPLLRNFREDTNSGKIKQTRSRYSYNFQSLKSWRKSHGLNYEYMDTDKMLVLLQNSVYNRFHYYLKLTSNNDDIKRFIDDYICQDIYLRLRDEINYFDEHDEYVQEAHKLTNRNTYSDFNDYYYSYLREDNKVHKTSRDDRTETIMSLEEIKKTNEFLDSLDSEINMFVSNKFAKFQGTI